MGITAFFTAAKNVPFMLKDPLNEQIVVHIKC